MRLAKARELPEDHLQVATERSLGEIGVAGGDRGQHRTISSIILGR